MSATRDGHSQTEGLPPNCPNCGSAMESGSVAAESLVGGAKWHKARSTLALGGEKIGDYTTGGMVWFDGYRCVKCRILLMRY